MKNVLDPVYVSFLLLGCLEQGKGPGQNLLMQFSTLGSSKMDISQISFFDILTIHNEQIPFVKHVLDPLYVFFALFGCLEGGIGPAGKRLRQNLPEQSTLYSSNVEISKLDFFDILAIHNDQISDAKHALDPLYKVFSLFGCLDTGMVACSL